MQEPLPAFTLRHVLERSARLFADRPALSHVGEVPVTFGELQESVHSLSHWLAEQGIGFGDAVVILGENCVNWGIAYFAVTTMGAVAVPVQTEFHSEAIVHIIRHSEAKAVFVSERLFPKIEETDFDPAILFVNLDSFVPMEPGITRDRLREMKSAGLREFRKWREKAMRFALNTPVEPGEDDLAAIIYTSGTSGHSKGVMLTHRNIVSNAVLGAGSIVTFTENDRMLSVLPLAHTFECTLGLVLPVLSGTHVFYLDKPPTARVLLPALTKVRPTVMAAVPLIMEKIYKTSILPKLTSNRLSRWLYSIPVIRKLMNRAAGRKLKETFGGEIWLVAIAGAPLAADAERFFREAKFPYAMGFGLTETSPLLTGTHPKDTRFSSSGKGVESVRMRIADKNPQTGEGEIQVQSPGVMQGYFKAPETTAEVFTEDGWFRTGDLGYLDSDGYVFIKGRSKNMVLGPNGENIYPEEVESIFFDSPYVVESLVYEQAGRLVARVHLDDGKLDELFAGVPEEELLAKRQDLLESIRQGVNKRVSTYARVHRIIDQTEPFEKTPTQKIKRYLYIDQ